MSVLFSDLDNTMIFSHHREIGNKKIVVEHLDGREQSFMTEFTYDFFTKADWLNIVELNALRNYALNMRLYVMVGNYS